MKNQFELHLSSCHGDSIVQIKGVEARKIVRNENCHQNTIKGKAKPKFPIQTPFRTLFMEIAKTSLSGELLA